MFSTSTVVKMRIGGRRRPRVIVVAHKRANSHALDPGSQTHPPLRDRPPLFTQPGSTPGPRARPSRSPLLTSVPSDPLEQRQPGLGGDVGHAGIL